MLGRAVWLCHLGAGQCCVGAGEVAPVPDPQPCGDSVPASRGCGDGRRDESGVLSPVEMCWGENGVWDHSLLLREEVGEAVLALLVCGFALCAVLLVDGSHVADGLWASCALWLVPGGICHSWLLCWGPCSRSSAVVLEGRPCLLG